MNEYKPDTPRAAFALGAVALMALTLGALVVGPAELDTGFAPEMTLARNVAVPTEVAITPARIEVVGVRATASAATPHDAAPGAIEPVASSVASPKPRS